MDSAKKKKIIIAAAIPAAAVLAVAAGIKWRTSYAKTEVFTSTSDAGAYKLAVYMIGEPVWPFGETNCRAELYIGSKRIKKLSFAVKNDGTRVAKENFAVKWYDDCVALTAYGEEQDEAKYVLVFNDSEQQNA